MSATNPMTPNHSTTRQRRGGKPTGREQQQGQHQRTEHGQAQLLGNPSGASSNVVLAAVPSACP
jgi:hypothetical protein